MTRLYLIGPVTGKPNNNLEEFERVRKLLEEQDHKVDIPHDFIGPRICWEAAMLMSIHKLTNYETDKLTPYYAGVALLDGFTQSRGALLETQIAQAVGIPCLPWHDYLRW